MEVFRRVTGAAAVLLEDNVDTDIIFPARFLLITARDGLGRYAFYDRMANSAIDRIRAGTAVVLIAGANFGCGSSREQAVWSLRDSGIRAIVAPSFGEIFAANCGRNGVLPMVLPLAEVRRLAGRAVAGSPITIDLEVQTITLAGDVPVAFAIRSAQRLALLNGWDETDLILDGYGAAINFFEAKQRCSRPWLYEAGDRR